MNQKTIHGWGRFGFVWGREVLAFFLREAFFFFAGAGLEGTPLFKVDETEAEADDEDAYGGVFDEVELVIFIGGLVNDDAVNFTRDDAAFN